MDGRENTGGSSAVGGKAQPERISRAQALRRGTIAATGGLATIIAANSGIGRAVAAIKPIGKSDVDILNYLLPFEYLLASIYNRAMTEKNDRGEPMPLKDPERELLTGLLTEEAQHVAGIQEMVEKLGGKPVKKGAYAFAFFEYETVLILAQELEYFAQNAYNYVIPHLKSEEARELALSIVQTEARHAATLLLELKEEPAPYGREEGLSEESSLVQIEKFTGPSIFE